MRIRTRLFALFAIPFLLVSCSTGGNRVLSLNGQTDFGHVPDQTALRLSGGDYTVAAWVQVAAHGENNNCVLSKRGAGNNNGWTFYVAGRAWPALAQKVIFHLSQGDNPFAVSKSTLNEGEWYHLCVVYRAQEKRLVLYVDGVEDAAADNIPPPNPDTNANLYLGRDSVFPRYFFNGMMDDVSVWQRALAPAEVPVLMGATLGGNEDGLLALWDFDAQNLRDKSGHGFDAELVGTAPAGN